MKPFHYLTLVVFLFMEGCHEETDSNTENTAVLRTLTSSENDVVSSSNHFAFEIFKKVQNENRDNIFISPFSISSALSMTLNGAEGKTKEGILNAIGFTTLQPAEVNEAYKNLSSMLLALDRKTELNVANSIWFRKDMTVTPTFEKSITTYYNAAIRGLNFADPNSKNTINNWVEQKTNNRINNLIESVSPEDAMFLVNAIYFKSDWKYKFDKTKSKEDLFYKEDGSTKTVEMMRSGKMTVFNKTTSSFQFLDLPYGNGQFSMSIILPNKDYLVDDIMSELSHESFQHVTEDADSSAVEVVMPKFKIKWGKTLNDDLAMLGMAVAFTREASFPYLFEGVKGLAISRVIHQSFISVDETGTEAAAATAVGITFTSTMSNVINLNRPFIFLIREKKTGAILFIGQLTDPAED